MDIMVKILTTDLENILYYVDLLVTMMLKSSNIFKSMYLSTNILKTTY